MGSKKILISILVVTILLIAIIIISLIVFKNIKDNNKYNINKVNAGGEEYNQKHLNSFDFKIINITEEIKDKVKDTDEFILKLKEYLYKKGLIEAKEAQIKSFAEDKDNNKIYVEVILKDKDNTTIMGTIDFNNNIYDFYVSK